MSTKMKRAFLAGRVRDGIRYDRFNNPIIEPLRLGKKKRRIRAPEANDAVKEAISDFKFETFDDSELSIVANEEIYENPDSLEIDSIPVESLKSDKERLLENFEKLQELVKCIPKEFLPTMIHDTERLITTAERLLQPNQREE
ncbi:uncharacterized protein LOC117168701 isoform X1 [Belonocnema kinseyi]|uniref:uncharacterized protein LOC117168701 isoform X1 n=1 Tax=Belonocnema kinseyi TaxID=2817044 RepID=UPI00143DF6AD|nr:uncharacterized protein LOC117168701 isoform X1 [Belonocnema kinseyi]XP_033210282.1 uncharacterized protein LOC117168701 isoform X1 [Belonocnema kinseyi]